MDEDIIYVVKRSISYEIAGEEYEVSHHKTEEGAYLKMDKVAPEYGFTREHIIAYSRTGEYSYSKDNESLYVTTIKLEE